MWGPVRGWKPAGARGLPTRALERTLALPIERLPRDPTRSIVRFRLIQFDGTKVGRTAREAVIDGWQQNARVDGLSLWIQTKVQVHGVIHVVPARRVGRLQILEDVI